ncbi:SURF1 family cytochrome oxidase biogenesis protein [Microbacterium sp.]|uniref:SURF1 family cytochrome oxidase biogenesis protein n=1 Tax=Microbacterium sp. TaxID=51671 RepID=UPI0025CC8BED|nr:SURF1 family cytochrome oxidase biogenesis protein [Microbacterium sp.]
MSRVAPVPEAAEGFPPTLREVMLRPWWIGMLVFALAVAALFAWLGQWQLARAIDSDPPPPGATEVVQPLGEVVSPGKYLPEPRVGQRVEVSGSWHPTDFLVVSSRFNGGTEGYWVTGQFRADPEPGSASGDPEALLAVAIGWAPTRQSADAAASALAAEPDPVAVTLTGRLISDEGPALPSAGALAAEMTRMSPAALLSQWSDVAGLDVYRPYLVADVDTTGFALPEGVVEIDSPAPDEATPVNWLNIFYAVEWVIFAGFAFYMWYRLARDAWEKELEDLEERTGPVQ